MKTMAILIVAAISIISTHGQGFLNLNFESAYNLTNPPPDGYLVSVANSLPGWTAYGTSGALTDIYCISNNFPGVSTLVELEGGTLALSGDFSAGVYPGGSISQTGLVPDNAESLQFEAALGVPNLDVKLGGETLSYTILSETPTYAVCGANIPAGMDGQMETLSFGVGDTGGDLLDNITFSPMSVPEPSELALVGFGGILFRLWRRRKKPRRE